MCSAHEDEHSRFKLAQLWHFSNSTFRRAQKSSSNECVINEILSDNFNINCKVTITTEDKEDETDLKDCTILHLAYSAADIDAFRILLERGADFTIKNSDGQTSLHLMIKSYDRCGVITRENDFMNSLLSAHVKSQNFINPRNDDGISHLHGACIVNHVEAVKLFLEYGASVDDAVNLDAPMFAGYTPLHFAAEFHSFEVAEILLNRGANVNARTADDRTPLDILIENKSNYHPPQAKKSGKEQLIKLLLGKNGISEIGLSSLQVAFTLRDLTIAERLISEGADINYTVPMESKSSDYAGSTALHFAALHSVEAVKMLVLLGAKLDVATDQGLTPLDICVNKYSLQDIICNILSCVENLKETYLSDGETRLLDLIATMGDVNQFKLFLENRIKDITVIVPSECPIWPGYTVLHLAVTFSAKLQCEAKENESSTEENEYFTYENEDDAAESYQKVFGQLPGNVPKPTRFGHCLRILRKLTCITRENEYAPEKNKCGTLSEKIYGQFTKNSLKSTCFSYCSRIFRTCVTKEDEHDTQENKNDYPIIRECLNYGHSVNVQNARGQTPIQLAFSQDKTDICRLLLEHLDQLGQLVNVVDENNLSYLHIACIIKKLSLVKQLLTKTDPNIAYKGKINSMWSITTGSTPLHMATVYRTGAIADILLRYGANLHAIDANGMTPIHLLEEGSAIFALDPDQQIVDVLLDALLKNPKNQVVEGYGLSYLHIACMWGRTEVIKKLLDLGSDVKAVVKCDDRISSSNIFEKFDYLSKAPIQIAIESINKDNVLYVLLRRDPYMFFGGSHELLEHIFSKIIKDIFLVRRLFEVSWEEADVQKCMEEKFGLTKLHIACYMKDEKAVKSILKDRVDINVPVPDDSLIYAGCTPLHLLMTITDSENSHLYSAEFSINGIIKMLLDRGADVTIANAKKDTPIHVFYREQRGFSGDDHCMDLLLNAHRDFSVNPVNVRGVSHFHIACYWHKVKVIEKFLQHDSVDVNQPIDYFVKHNAGCTPLHLTLTREMEPDGDWVKLLQVVELLLSHGANIAAKDVYGDTPMHKPAVLKSPENKILEKLISYGGDIKNKNVQGRSPIEPRQDIEKVYVEHIIQMWKQVAMRN